jgi:hypothetical protein
VNLKGKGSIGLMINKYIALYYSIETHKFGSQLLIGEITNLSMNIIILLIAHITGSTSLHQDSWEMMFYAR